MGSEFMGYISNLINRDKPHGQLFPLSWQVAKKTTGQHNSYVHDLVRDISMSAVLLIHSVGRMARTSCSTRCQMWPSVHLHLSDKLYTLYFVYPGEATSSGCLGACGLEKRNLSSLHFLNHLLTLCKKQKSTVSYIFDQTNKHFTLHVVLILLGNTNDGRFYIYITLINCFNQQELKWYFQMDCKQNLRSRLSQVILIFLPVLVS